MNEPDLAIPASNGRIAWAEPDGLLLQWDHFLYRPGEGQERVTRAPSWDCRRAPPHILVWHPRIEAAPAATVPWRNVRDCCWALRPRLARPSLPRAPDRPRLCRSYCR